MTQPRTRSATRTPIKRSPGKSPTLGKRSPLLSPSQRSTKRPRYAEKKNEHGPRVTPRPSQEIPTPPRRELLYEGPTGSTTEEDSDGGDSLLVDAYTNATQAVQQFLTRLQDQELVQGFRKTTQAIDEFMAQARRDYKYLNTIQSQKKDALLRVSILATDVCTLKKELAEALREISDLRTENGENVKRKTRLEQDFNAIRNKVEALKDIINHPNNVNGVLLQVPTVASVTPLTDQTAVQAFTRFPSLTPTITHSKYRVVQFNGKTRHTNHSESSQLTVGPVWFAHERLQRKYIRGFLDLEAEVENESSSDDDMEFNVEGFIDEDVNLQEDNSHRAWQYNDWAEDSERRNALFERILQRASESGQTERIEEETDSGAEGSGHVLEMARVAQRLGDYPLWKVKTRIGIEEIALASLVATAEPKHELRSAFSRGSIRGAIYLECTMNNPLRALLQKTPGIVRGVGLGIVAKTIDISDNLQLLKMPLAANEANKGQWIVVKRGIYKGDPGLVVDVDRSGCEVLLVPRRSVQDHLSTTPTRKRKATQEIPPATLYDGYPHGLLRKKLDWHSVSQNVFDIPFKHYLEFRASNHPDVDRGHMPRPSEWKFRIGDRVVIVSENRGGSVIETGNTYGVEVARDMSPYELIPFDWDTALIPWHNVRKCVSEGDFVVTTAMHDFSQSGWVTAVDGETCDVCSYLSPEDIKTWKIHVNLVEVTTAPWTRRSGTGAMTFSSRKQQEVVHPWCGVDVVVVSKGPYKQAQGKILDVIGDSSTETEGAEIGLDLQFLTYNPASPFQRKRFRYSDVLESSTRKELMLFRNPGEGFIRTSPPVPKPNDSERERSVTTTTAIVTASVSTSEQTGGTTPMWDREMTVEKTVSSAWDPESQLTDHCLLNPLLVDLEVQAHVKGGNWPNGKQMPVWIVDKLSGGVELRGRRTRTEWLTLEPGWVTVKVPSAKLDNSLLVIIRGSHCGKFARRIHHLDNHKGPYALEVAIVTRVSGAGDRLTGEVLTLDLDHFAIIDKETEKEKASKNMLMQELRAPWKTR